MDWQLGIVILVVALAGVYFVRRLTRQVKGEGKQGCEKCDPQSH